MSADRPNCKCGNLVEKSHTRVDNTTIWSECCRTCRGRQRYGILKKDSCEDCGFVPLTPNQLEIDHVNGDSKDNSKSNLRTLCCNCHAYKSYINRDIVFKAKSNPFYGQKHSQETLEKIRKARQQQAERQHAIRKN